jgi:hypothetical protein
LRLRRESRPLKRNEFEPAAPACPKLPLTLTSRVQRGRVRSSLESRLHVFPTRRPAWSDFTEKRTLAGAESA